MYNLLALSWKVIYIGHASNLEYDQLLQEAVIDDLQMGQMKFVLEVSFVTHAIGTSA